MKKTFLTIIILFGLCGFLTSCTWSKSIPEGSRSLGVYDGPFNGVRYGGTIRVELLQTPEGAKLFRATVSVEPNEISVPKALFVRGEMTGNALQGEFQGSATGTFSGRLSPDGNRLTGAFDIISPGLNNGTWKAQKK